MEKRRRPRRYDRSAKPKGHPIPRKNVPKTPERRHVERLMEKYQMDEAAALEIVHGASTLEIWLEREGNDSIVNHTLINKIKSFSNQTSFSPKGAIEILKGLYIGEHSEEKQLGDMQKQEISRLVQQYNLPTNVAWKIVKGDQNLEGYLDEERQGADRRQKAMEIHAAYPAIALPVCYQIVDWGISPKEYLERRSARRQRREEWYHRMLEDHREENRLLNEYLQKLRNRKIRVMFSFFRRNSLMGTVVSYNPYSIRIREKRGIHKYPKVEIKYFARAAYAERFLPVIKVNEEIRNHCIEPAHDPQKRYQIPEGLLEEGKELLLMLGGGEIFHGTIDWFSRYDIKLSLHTQQKSSVVVFRHAVVAASAG